VGFLVYLCLILPTVVLCLAWLLRYSRERVRYTLFDIEDQQQIAMSEIAARTRRAEEQMRRVAYQSRLR
jgi:hypothetical protein